MNKALLILLVLAVVGLLSVFAYSQSVLLRQEQEQVRKLNAKLESSSKTSPSALLEIQEDAQGKRVRSYKLIHAHRPARINGDVDVISLIFCVSLISSGISLSCTYEVSI